MQDLAIKKQYSQFIEQHETGNNIYSLILLPIFFYFSLYILFSHIFSWKDSKTYLSLGIPPERVFTVGKKGKRNVVYDETEMSVEREKKKNKRRFIRIKRKLEEDAEGNSDDEEKHENEMTFEMLYERVNEFFPPCEPWNSS